MWDYKQAGAQGICLGVYKNLDIWIIYNGGHITTVLIRPFVTIIINVLIKTENIK